MKQTFIRFLVIAFLMLSITSAFSQKGKSNFEIQLYGVPYYKLSNHFYENRMIMHSDYFKLDYAEKINQEVGFNLKYKYKKWKFGIGLAYNTFEYAHSLYLVDNANFTGNDLSYHIERELKIRTVGLALLTEKELSKTISLGIRVSLNSLIKNEINGNLIDRLEISNSRFILREQHKTGVTRLLLIPELYLHKNIYKGLDLMIGCKFKFYNEPFEGGKEFYSLEVDSRSKTVFSYTIDTYQTGFFFGASYTFQLPKLRKSKVE